MKSLVILILFLFQSYIIAVKGADVLIPNSETDGFWKVDSLHYDSAISEDSNRTFFLKSNLPIQFSGYSQIRYQHFDQKRSNDGFDIYHTRLNLKGIISPALTYRIQAEFVGKGAPKLIDAYGEWKFKSYIIFTAGQFYIPLSLENMTPDEFLESVYRSQVVNALANRSNDVMGDNSGRDIGAQISGSFLKLNNSCFIDYKLGIFNGAGINVTADNNNYKDVGGRLVFHPLAGVDFGTSIYHGVAYYGTQPANHIHNRQGLDLNVTYSDFNFKAEYLQGKDSSDVRRSGYYAQGIYYIIPKVFDVLIKYDTYNPNLVKSNNYETDYTASLGYSFSAYSRLQAAYVFQREHITQIKNNYAVLRLQIGF
jgi:hypothetical protein